jgi:hypothetical protein
MDSKLRHLAVLNGHSYQGIITQVEELVARARVTHTFSKKKYNAIKSEHRAIVEGMENDVARQQNSDLSFFRADRADQGSARNTLELPQVSWLSRWLKSFQDMVFFLFLDTWSSPLVTLPDSEDIFMVRDPYFVSLPLD